MAEIKSTLTRDLEAKERAKRITAKEWYDSKKTDDGIKMDQADIDAFKAMNDELEALATERKVAQFGDRNAAEIESMDRVANGLDTPEGRSQAKSMGEQVTESAAFKSWNEGGRQGNASVTVDYKTTMSLGAGWAATPTYLPGFVPSPLGSQSRPLLQSIIARNVTDTSDIRFWYESTFTNAAAESNESGTVAESTIALSEGTATVRTISHLIPVTEQQIRSQVQVVSLINNRLPQGIELRKERQIILGSGTGTPTQLLGMLNHADLQTYAKVSTEPVFDALLKGQTKVRNSGNSATWDSAEANFCAMHPNDWQDLVLTRTNDGLYILGNPDRAPVTSVWGMTPFITPSITENTCLCGDSSFAEIWEQTGIVIDIGYNSDDFGKLQRSIRGYQMLAFLVRRGAAFVSVTSI